MKAHHHSSLLFAAISLTASGVANSGTFQTLGDLPGGIFSSAVGDVSEDGSVVVGSGATDDGFEAFRWNANEGMIGMGDLPGGIFRSFAASVSEDGEVIVGNSDSMPGYPSEGREAFRWTLDEGMVGLGDLPGGRFRSFAMGVSRDGSVVAGFGETSSGPEAFVWTGETGVVPLGVLPGGTFSVCSRMSADGPVVVGYGNSSSGYQIWTWTVEDGMIGRGGFPGNNFHVPLAVSTDGSVLAGWSRSPATGQASAWRWTEQEGFIGLGILPGFDACSAWGVSPDGSVIVGACNTSDYSMRRAFIWDETNGMRSLHDVVNGIPGIDLNGATLIGATALSQSNARLSIAGTVWNADGHQEAYLFRAHLVELNAMTPVEAIVDLALMVLDLNLHNGIENSLDAKLDSALNALDDANENNDQAACNSLQAFINAVEAQSGNKIDEEDADVLIAAAQGIIDLICPPE